MDEKYRGAWLDALADQGGVAVDEYETARKQELQSSLDIDILSIGLAQREAQIRLELMADDPKAAAWKIESMLAERQREDYQWNYLQIKINLLTAEYNEARAAREVAEMTYSLFKARLYAEGRSQ